MTKIGESLQHKGKKGQTRFGLPWLESVAGITNDSDGRFNTVLHCHPVAFGARTNLQIPLIVMCKLDRKMSWKMATKHTGGWK